MFSRLLVSLCAEDRQRIVISPQAIYTLWLCWRDCVREHFCFVIWEMTVSVNIMWSYYTADDGKHFNLQIGVDVRLMERDEKLSNSTTISSFSHDTKIELTSQITKVSPITKKVPQTNMHRLPKCHTRQNKKESFHYRLEKLFCFATARKSSVVRRKMAKGWC